MYNFLFVHVSRRGSRGIIVPDPAVFLCISMLARAVGPNIEVEIRPVLDQIFALGLSLELTNALKVLAREIPSLQKDIQGLLLFYLLLLLLLSLYRWTSQNVVYDFTASTIQASWCT